ncbi:MAG TPA: alkaline phosphatase PhoX [Phycisphaerales bacterium]
MQMNCLAAAALAALAGSAFGQSAIKGPSSSQTPYLVPSPTVTGVDTISILTVGDTIGGYRLVGIPDGMGALRNAANPGTFDLFVNHELNFTQGVVRAHGQTGAFISRWNINTDPSNLAVNAGRDHNTSFADAFEWNGAAWTNAAGIAQRWGRWCSADLAAPSAYKFGTLGTDARIYLNGEEVGPEGRNYAHIVTGPAANQSWRLPRLGRFSVENQLASPFPQLKTVVMGLDDATPGQLYVYIGTKTAAGNDVERAGLTNGSLYGVRVAGLALETRASGASGRFDLFNLGNVENTTGAVVQTNSVAAGVTEFLRPEDGHWDPRTGRQNDFYFVTTDRYNTAATPGNSRLYRLRFDDITDPTLGGKITMLVDGFTSGPQMMDNMCIDPMGRVLIQEDIGNQAALGKIWVYNIENGKLREIARHDPARFSAPVPPFSQDEESSGIIDMFDILGKGWYTLNVQAHYPIAGELVEGGQLLAMRVDLNIACPGDFNNDTFTDDADFVIFAAAYNSLLCPGGTVITSCPWDINGDGEVSDPDFVLFAQGYNDLLCQ